MALNHYEPWRYFGANQTAARTALRTKMGASYAVSPTNDELDAILQNCVAYLEKYTGRFFVPRQGRLKLDGRACDLLPLPYPVVSAEQLVGGGVTEVIIGDPANTAIDLVSFQVAEGAIPGVDDPRDYPSIRMGRISGASGVVSGPPMWGRMGRIFPAGFGNILVTATWGYLEPDGTTPPLILQVLARLCIFYSAPNDDLGAVEDRTRSGGLISESVRDRSYSYGDAFISGGLTGDREIDRILAGYRRPPEARISINPSQRSRGGAFVE